MVARSSAFDTVIARAPPEKLEEIHERYAELRRKWLREMVLQRNRIDILAREILGYEVHPHHLAIMQHQMRHPRSLTLAWRGGGKCLEPGTLVMMSDGSTKEVERIRVGDFVMGPDSKPRRVTSLGNGVGRLYRIVPKKGDSWVCNDEHILTLKGRGHFYGGEIRDLPVKEVIKMGERAARGTLDMKWKLWRVPVDFADQPLPVDPYFFGLWLGDGTTGETAITKPDDEIRDYLHGFAAENGYVVKKVVNSSGCPSWRLTCGDEFTETDPDNGVVINPLRRFLRSLGDKKIPDEFLRNTRKKRLALLAGLLDSDGHLSHGGFEITQKREHIARAVVFLARSLGFGAYLTKKIATIKARNFEGEYFRVTISGDVAEIPCRIERKKATPRLSPKDPLVVGFKIEDAGVGEFYGFTVDGDGRFLLGDFTVTHNSTVATITKAVHLILKNPNIRILVASKSAQNAEGFLKAIKGHFENNKTLEEIFGQFYDPRLCRKWDTREMEVLPRTSNAVEATVTTVGVEGTTVGKHYDVHLPDDIVDENNSRTGFMRSQVKTWFYKSLDPTLEPPDDKVPDRGQCHMSGTRYHPSDFYATLMGEDASNDDGGGEMKGHTLKIPVEDADGRSAWPEKFTKKWVEDTKRRHGIIIFNSQYKLDTEAMKGSIFRFDDCQRIEEEEVPKGLPAFQGVDLAVGEDAEKGDHFSITTIKYDKKTDTVYVVDWFDDVVRFNEQRNKIIDLHDQYDPVRCLVEAVAYQAVQVSEVKRKRPDLRVYGVKQRDDKTTKMQKFSARFDEGKIFFVKGGKIHLLIDQLVRFPNDDVHDDGPDSLELACRATRMRFRRKRRRLEPGLM